MSCTTHRRHSRGVGRRDSRRGLATTFLSLVALHFVQRQVETDILSFTIHFIPFGALLIGMCAGSGYGFASYFANVRVRKGLLSLIGLLLFAGYVAVEYIAFRREGSLFWSATGAPVTFAEWYQIQATGMRWQSREGPMVAVGNWGYLLRAVGVLGFVGGGLFAPAVLNGQTYCQLCNQYMRSRRLLNMPASASLPRRILKKSFSINTEEHRAALGAAVALMDEVQTRLVAGDVTGTRAALNSPAAHEKVRGRMPLIGRQTLTYCPGCHDGRMVTELVNNGSFQTALGREIDSVPLGSDTIRSLVIEARKTPKPLKERL